MAGSEELTSQEELRHRVITKDYYDAAQWFYDVLWHGDSLGLHYGFWIPGIMNRKDAIIAENRILAEKAGIKAGDLVLDAGCGVAGSGIWLAKEIGAKVVGLNIVRKQLTRGKKLAEERGLLAANLRFTEADYQRLPFKPGSFDIFWSLESIEHSHNIDDLVREAYRALKTGGKLVIAGTFKGKNNLNTEELKKIQVGQEAAGAFYDFRTADQMAEALNHAGFKNVQNEDATELVMESSKQMTQMCKWGLPIAKLGAALHLTSPIIALNNKWGTYQQGLFESGATSYHILTAKKL